MKIKLCSNTLIFIPLFFVFFFVLVCLPMKIMLLVFCFLYRYILKDMYDSNKHMDWETAMLLQGKQCYERSLLYSIICIYLILLVCMLECLIVKIEILLFANCIADNGEKVYLLDVILRIIHFYWKQTCTFSSVLLEFHLHEQVKWWLHVWVNIATYNVKCQFVLIFLISFFLYHSAKCKIY